MVVTLKEKMEHRGLLFIPDISGFTRFVNESEIEHSRLIIQELLELLLNANRLGLEVSEIEGDAILFYKFGASPDLKELYHQVETMFREFHRHLNAYEWGRYCQCRACTSAVDLTLKVITHYGEFTSYNVKNFSKLIGKDVIVAHQLLKNDIEQHEYWLVTQNLLPDPPPASLTEWMQWNSSTKKTETGEVPFHYTQLTPLKLAMPPEPPPGLELARKARVLSASREYATGILALLHACGDPRLRARWQEDVKSVEDVDFILPRVGMRFRCLTESGEAVIYLSSYSYSPERIEFSETDERQKCLHYYTLETTGEARTRLTIEVYIKKSFAAPLLFQWTRKKKMQERLLQSMHHLEALAKEIQLPVEE